MPEPIQRQHCGKCGATLSGYAPDGLCAACLLESAFDEPDAPGGDAIKPGPLLAFNDYELLEEIARGGMGVVYRARQRSLNRTVAIKMILGGHLANAAEMQRFRSEAETAAQLQHPNIVAIHEVGEHAGQPFFSMDLVQGQNLSQLVRDEPLPSRKAAAYLKTIAEAVQYAHAHGVLHRDLKPSNILIDENDQPRITDFGLAKRFSTSVGTLSTASQSESGKVGDLVEHVPTYELTQTGHILGSPSFIPPEQAAGQKKAIGPASDVYSLGAILYHCLTGRPPFVAESLTQTLRLVAEQEPVSPRLLNASVPRDLETMCLKCLEKDPTRRYATARELADELGRFLRQEPIRARPTGLILKTHRWCMRNKALAVSGTAILALLLVVAVGSPVAALRINRARQQAEANEKQARKEAAKSFAAFLFMSRMLEGVSPSVARGRDSTMLREILDETARRVHEDLKDQPDAEADLRIVLGKAYSDLGLTTNALEMTQEALRLRREHLGLTNAAVADALNNLGAMLYDANDYVGAEKAAREALTMRTNLLGLWHTNVATSFNNLGQALWNQGRLAEAMEAQQGALKIRKRILPPDHPDIAMSLANLAVQEWSRANFLSAETNFAEALELFRKAGKDRAVAVLQANLATVLSRRGELAAAKELHEQTLAFRRKLFQADHPDLEISLTQLGLVLATQGDLAAAEARLTEALAMQDRLSLGKHVDVADALAGLGIVRTKKGDWAGAGEKLQEALVIRIDRLKGETNPDVVDTLDALGLLAIAGGDLEAAQKILARAVDAAKRSESPDHPAVIPTLWHLAWVLEKRGDATDADARRREALAISAKLGVYGGWPLVQSIYDLADLLLIQSGFPEAEPLLKQAAAYVEGNLRERVTLQRDACLRLALFYEAWDRAAPNTGKASQAADWRKKL